MAAESQPVASFMADLRREPADASAGSSSVPKASCGPSPPAGMRSVAGAASETINSSTIGELSAREISTRGTSSRAASSPAAPSSAAPPPAASPRASPSTTIAVGLGSSVDERGAARSAVESPIAMTASWTAKESKGGGAATAAGTARSPVAAAEPRTTEG